MTTLLNRPEALPEPAPQPEILPLEMGDHLDQPTFHARYEAMPEGTRAELIGGIVYMPSPTKLPHSRPHLKVSMWAGLYESFTPGVMALDNTSVILANDGEAQPDVCLLIPPERGGRTREETDYITGAPELVVEVASSSASYDLHSKKADYERAGVQEYVVVVVREARVAWFALRNGRFEELPPGEDGILRSEVFPGLWLDPAALLRNDGAALRETLERGLASPEHAEFAARMRDPA